MHAAAQAIDRLAAIMRRLDREPLMHAALNHTQSNPCPRCGYQRPH